MARKLNEIYLETRAARARLKARDKPYFRTLDEGVHLGYRKGQRGGKWVVRLYAGDQAYRVETLAGLPDDAIEADGVAVFSYAQAKAEAQRRYVAAQRVAQGAPPVPGPYTVADAMADYLTYLDAERRTGYDARCRAEALILPRLGKVAFAALTSRQLEAWRDDLATAPARIQSGKGPQRYRAVSDEQDKRRRRSTANRTWTILRAALNRAHAKGHVGSDAAWRPVKPFRGADVARARWLDIDEGRRLINTAQGGFRDLVQAALATGCRYGELAALTVADFDAERGRLYIARSKTGKARHVVLNDEGVALFERLTAGRPGSEALLRKDTGAEWHRSNQRDPLVAACGRAGIAPAVNFHALRHTYASHAVMAGAPLVVVAKNLGNSVAMIERHYGHLADDFMTQAIRAAAPRFGLEPQAGSVTPLASRRKKGL